MNQQSSRCKHMLQRVCKICFKKKKKKEETDFELKDNALDGVITLIMMNWYFEKDNAAHTTICHVNLKKN